MGAPTQHRAESPDPEVAGRSRLTFAMNGRRPRPIVLVVAGLGVLLFVVALVVQVVGHTSLDPTEQSFAVRLQNDTAGTVVVKQCDATCNSFHEQDRLPPGGSVEVNTSSDDVANWWAVTDSTGRTVRCLPLRYKHAITGLVVKVSEHTGCPTAGAGSSGVLGSVVGFGLLFAAAGIGLASIAFSTISAHRWIVGRGLTGGAAAAMTVSAALLAFLGGWLIFDVYVLIRACSRLVRPAPITGPR